MQKTKKVRISKGRYMITVKTTSFCKQASCPSSATLLSYRELGLETEVDGQVAGHLKTCDFCCAELQLLAECPQAPEEFLKPAAIPLPLRRLAEEILSGSLLTADMFSESCFDKARLTFTDA
jgi:hypothetical protein